MDYFLDDNGAIADFPADNNKLFYNRCSCWKSSTNIYITDTKLHVPVVTLSTQENAKLLQQLKSRFKRTINWNKYQSKVTTVQGPNRYLD